MSQQTSAWARINGPLFTGQRPVPDITGRNTSQHTTQHHKGALCGATLCRHTSCKCVQQCRRSFRHQCRWQQPPAIKQCETLTNHIARMARKNPSNRAQTPVTHRPAKQPQTPRVMAGKSGLLSSGSQKRCACWASDVLHGKPLHSWGSCGARSAALTGRFAET